MAFILKKKYLFFWNADKGSSTRNSYSVRSLLQTEEPMRKITTTTTRRSCFEDCSSWEHSAWRCKLGCSGKTLLNGDLCHSKMISHMVFNITTTFIKGFPITSLTYLIFGEDSGRRRCMRTPSHRAQAWWWWWGGGVGGRNGEGYFGNWLQDSGWWNSLGTPKGCNNFCFQWQDNAGKNS